MLAGWGWIMLRNSIRLDILDPIWQILEDEAYPMSGNSPEYLLVSSWARVWSLILLCNQAPNLVSNRGWNLVNACSHSLVDVYKLDLMCPKEEELERELSSALEKQTNSSGTPTPNASEMQTQSGWSGHQRSWSGLKGFSPSVPGTHSSSTSVHMQHPISSLILIGLSRCLWGLTEADTWGRGISTG